MSLPPPLLENWSKVLRIPDDFWFVHRPKWSIFNYPLLLKRKVPKLYLDIKLSLVNPDHDTLDRFKSRRSNSAVSRSSIQNQQKKGLRKNRRIYWYIDTTLFESSSSSATQLSSCWITNLWRPSWLNLLHYLWDFGKIAQHHRGSVGQSDQIFYQILSFWSDLILSRQDVSDSQSTSASARGGKKKREIIRNENTGVPQKLEKSKKGCQVWPCVCWFEGVIII